MHQEKSEKLSRINDLIGEINILSAERVPSTEFDSDMGECSSEEEAFIADVIKIEEAIAKLEIEMGI